MDVDDLARVSMSTSATAADRSMSLTDDIRSDLAAGWDAPGDDGRSASLTMSDTDESDADGDEALVDQGEYAWRLDPAAVPAVPAHYPLDAQGTRRLVLGPGGKSGGDAGGVTVDLVSRRISSACQAMSVYGRFDDGSPSAGLATMEQVEMDVALYYEDGHDENGGGGGNNGSQTRALLVEVQRRNGCLVTFHRYRRNLLDAASGTFDRKSFQARDGLDRGASGRDRTGNPRATLGSTRELRRPPPLTRGPPTLARSVPGAPRVTLDRPSLSPPSLARGGAAASPAMSSEGDAHPPLKPPPASPSSPAAAPAKSNVEKALVALNIASSLIKKDRIDARRLGMESLVLLTDPLRAGMETAVIASRVVLLGTAREGLALGEGGLDVPTCGRGESDVDALFDESSGLGIRESLLDMLMSADNGEDGARELLASHSKEGDAASVTESQDFDRIEREFTDTIFNLCLTVLSNALNTVEKCAKIPEEDGDLKPSSSGDDGNPSPNRRRAATEPALPLGGDGAPRRFIDDTRTSLGCDVLSSLVRILGQARSNPHDAYHSARCLGVLFRGCGEGHRARARRDLDAKRIVAAALEVGCRTHARLEGASREALEALSTTSGDGGGSAVAEESKMDTDGDGESSQRQEEAMDEDDGDRKMPPGGLDTIRSEEEDDDGGDAPSI